jgi:predicted amidohydrolase
MRDHQTTRRGFLATGGVTAAGAVTAPASAHVGGKAPAPEQGDARPVAIALIQMRCDPSPADNLKKAIQLVEDARSRGADLIVLPELFATPYFCQSDAEADIAAAKKDFAVMIPGLTTFALARAARDNGVVLVGGSVFERAGDKYFNTSVVFDRNGAQIGRYRKTHIPHDPGFWEQSYFSPGDTGVRVFNTPVGKVAVLICYDQWFPEAARLATLRGAEVLVYPTAIGDVDLIQGDEEGNWRDMWTAAQVGHAACNNVFVAAANRVGREGRTTFWGGSFVADPCGQILKQAGVAEEVVVVRCDLARVRKMQAGWRFLKERRPDMYAGLAQSGT